LRYVLWNFITVLHEASPTAGILALRSASTSLVMVLTEVHVPPTTHTDTHQRGCHVLEFAALINLRYRLHTVLHAFTIRGR
jgi:hypothetical protein